MKKNINTNSHKRPHFPFENPPFTLSMGLLKVPEEEWFEISNDNAISLACCVLSKHLNSEFFLLWQQLQQ